MAAVAQHDAVGRWSRTSSATACDSSTSPAPASDAQAGGAVQRRAEVVAAPLERLAGVHRHPQARARRRPATARRRARRAAPAPRPRLRSPARTPRRWRRLRASTSAACRRARRPPRRRARRAARAPAPWPSGRASHSADDSTMSVSRNVTTPDGSAVVRPPPRRGTRAEHLEVDGLGLGRRVDAELFDERDAAPLPDPQRLAALAGRRERPHQLPVGRLPSRRRVDERVAVPPRSRVPGSRRARCAAPTGRAAPARAGRAPRRAGVDPVAVVGEEAARRDRLGGRRGSQRALDVAGGRRRLGVGDGGDQLLEVDASRRPAAPAGTTPAADRQRRRAVETRPRASRRRRREITALSDAVHDSGSCSGHSSSASSSLRTARCRSQTR